MCFMMPFSTIEHKVYVDMTYHKKLLKISFYTCDNDKLKQEKIWNRFY